MDRVCEILHLQLKQVSGRLSLQPHCSMFPLIELSGTEALRAEAVRLNLLVGLALGGNQPFLSFFHMQQRCISAYWTSWPPWAFLIACVDH